MLIVAGTTKGHQRPHRYKGIVAAARALGVTREHLYRVLIGERVSPRIMNSIRLVHASSEETKECAGAPARSSAKGNT
jgi:hypothetical protein